MDGNSKRLKLEDEILDKESKSNLVTGENASPMAPGLLADVTVTSPALTFHQMMALPHLYNIYAMQTAMYGSALQSQAQLQVPGLPLQPFYYGSPLLQSSVLMTNQLATFEAQPTTSNNQSNNSSHRSEDRNSRYSSKNKSSNSTSKHKRDERYKSSSSSSAYKKRDESGYDRREVKNGERWRDEKDRSRKERDEERRRGEDSGEIISASKLEKIMGDIFTRKVKYKRSTPLEPYYQQQSAVVGDGSRVMSIVTASTQLMSLRDKFTQDILKRASKTRSKFPPFSFPKRPIRLKAHKHNDECGFSCDSDSDTDSDLDDTDSDVGPMQELERKKLHPWRLHQELWYNDHGEMNDGPVCRCSLRAQRSGIRHGIYLGEEVMPRCNPNTNNRDRLYHYLIVISPVINFQTGTPTVIRHDGHSFYFEGFSLLSHFPLPNSFPSCKIIRYNIEYTITFVEDDFPQNFCVGDIDTFYDYVFVELLELVDLNLKAKNDPDGCNRFHFLPRFVRLLEDNGKEILAMSVVLEYLYHKSKPIIDPSRLSHYHAMRNSEWNELVKQYKGTLVTCPGMKPCSIRVDQIDREKDDPVEKTNTGDEANERDNKPLFVSQNNLDDRFPVIVHFGIRPPQLSYAGNPKYQKAWRDYVKYRHLLANKEKVSYQDKQILAQKEEKLQEMRSKSDLKRDVTVVVSSKGFYATGLQCDIVQHSLIIPVVAGHLRFHFSLQYLEKGIGYTFKDRSLLQLALTHPSYRENFGTNTDHARNTLTNCGLRYVQYGDRRVHFMNTRKRGINMLINIMSRFGCNEETASNINHNERLEFLGDAVVEFLTSIHLFFLFPDLEEGGLATYRAALVQNQHLAVLARKLQLEKFMLYAHGSDLCHDLELRHAMANCFEAFMGALFLDGGIDVADKVFSRTLFDESSDESRTLHEIWINYSRHPLQRQYPNGDRHFISTVPRLRELVKFEEMTGIEFTHIRLLARAFTHRSVGYNNLTLGSNQRMEFLGDTVLQLIASDYLYKYFPDHHEGHLSLLRSSLVNNKTQAVVCDDLGITNITQYNSIKLELKTKDRADLLEAFIGALYVDKGILYCRRFCEVCFFPRLEHFIMNQDWNDPKSKLQQCCLTLRSAEGGEPDIPIYKVIESKGPTNTRVYEVAVYFRDRRLATGKGHSIQEAEMTAATNALNQSKDLFPHLVHQKRVIERNIKSGRSSDSSG